MKQLLLIVNPSAGTKKAEKYLAPIVSVFNRAGYDTHVYITTGHGDVARLVKNRAKDMDLLVCCGGDGTLNETVTGIIEAGLSVPVGYIPAGSTNDFAGSLHLPLDVVKAAKQIVSGTPHAYDVGTFGDRCFVYVASFGAFTKTSYTTPQNIKNALGHMAYVLEGIQELTSLHKEHLRLEIDGKICEGDYLFGAVCNTTKVGGVITLDPATVDLSDGKFEVLLVRYPNDLQEWGECLTALRTQKYDGNIITLRTAKTVTVWANGQSAWSLDGEKADGITQVRIDNLPRRLQLIH